MADQKNLAQVLKANADAKAAKEAAEDKAALSAEAPSEDLVLVRLVRPLYKDKKHHDVGLHWLKESDIPKTAKRVKKPKPKTPEAEAKKE